MGLTIHYKLKSNAESTDEARRLVEALREFALKLPFKEVGNIVEFKGEDCDFHKADKDDEYRWLKVQSQQYIDGGIHSFAGVIPSRIIAFTTWPGEGCEEANFGLCLYPESIEIEGENVSTGLGTGSLWKSFCKTQYASNPECGGVENFLKCHLAVISLLDHAKSMGILESVSDESDYWEKRDLEALVNGIGEWNEFIAAFSGALKDALGESDKDAKLVSEISKHPGFERMEAGFERKNPEQTDSMRRTARVIAALVGGIADDHKNET